jgi:hypothetical protein
LPEVSKAWPVRSVEPEPDLSGVGLGQDVQDLA